MVIKVIFTSFVLCSVLSYGVLKLFPKLGLMDRPEKYGLKRAPIPYPAGVALFLSFLISSFLFLPLTESVQAVLIGATLLAGVSFIDDRKDISPYFRLIIQVLAGFILVLGGIGMTVLSDPFGGHLALDQIQIPIVLGQWTFTFTLLADLLTILWVGVMVNAFNWIDGVPGMTTSIAAVTSFILLLLSMRPDFHYVDQTLAILLSSIILGMSLAFLIFDFPPPKFIIGDTGSMLLGFLLAATALISGGKIATTLLVLGFPILDFLWVIGRRLWKGHSPFKGDLWHFHHRFLKAGYTERQVVLFFVFSAILFGVIALGLQTFGKLWALVGIFLFMLGLVFFLYSKTELEE